MVEQPPSHRDLLAIGLGCGLAGVVLFLDLGLKQARGGRAGAGAEAVEHGQRGEEENAMTVVAFDATS